MALSVLGTAGLTACSDEPDKASSGNNSGTASGESSAPADPGGDPKVLAKLSDVQVGGGTVVTGADGSPILLVRNGETEVKAYDAKCTHAGTTIGEPQNGVSTCPNHGSQFNTADGSVTKGPAASPLKTIDVTVAGDSITVA
jgi:nitrite reductase/ring-hydroxylating ferredoxin subunit